MSYFEAAMIICFGLAWPASIYKSWKSRKTGSKSIKFLVVIFLGYVAGILNKIFYSFDWVIILYLLNLLMVGIDILLYLRNLKLEKEAL